VVDLVAGSASRISSVARTLKLSLHRFHFGLLRLRALLGRPPIGVALELRLLRGRHAASPATGRVDPELQLLQDQLDHRLGVVGDVHVRHHDALVRNRPRGLAPAVGGEVRVGAEQLLDRELEHFVGTHGGGVAAAAAVAQPDHDELGRGYLFLAEGAGPAVRAGGALCVKHERK
jgi:hypothetical protein